MNITVLTIFYTWLKDILQDMSLTYNSSQSMWTRESINTAQFFRWGMKPFRNGSPLVVWSELNMSNPIQLCRGELVKFLNKCFKSGFLLPCVSLILWRHFVDSYFRGYVNSWISFCSQYIHIYIMTNIRWIFDFMVLVWYYPRHT